MLGLAVGGAARPVLIGLSFTQCQDFDVIVGALRQNFSPVQHVQIYLAGLKIRKRKANEPLPELGHDIAYPLADQAIRETIGINAFINAMPGPAIEIQLHIICGQPKSLQEAVADALEVDAVLEASKPKAPSRRAQVQQMDYEKPADAED